MPGTKLLAKKLFPHQRDKTRNQAYRNDGARTIYFWDNYLTR